MLEQAEPRALEGNIYDCYSRYIIVANISLMLILVLSCTFMITQQ